MSSNKPSLPKGTRDFAPLVAAKRNHIVEIIKKHFRLKGFSEIQTPALENLSVLTGKYGAEGDQLIFKVLNSGDFLKSTNSTDFAQGSKHLLGKIADKGLRYDLTVPFARFVVQNQHEISMPFKRFQIQPVWRADRPQKGRYREFYQCDADIVGSESLWNEVELTELIHNVFKDLHYPGFEVQVNHRKLLNAMAQYVGLNGRETTFATSIDKLDKVDKEVVIKELVDVGAQDEKVNDIFKLFENGGDTKRKIDLIRLKIGEPGSKDLLEYFDQLEKLMGTDHRVVLNPSLARGLSYYTGMIFEVKATDVRIGSICGGGRYDNLTGVFGLKNVSGVGISFGLDRIYDVLEEKDLFPGSLSERIKVLIGHLDEESFLHGIELLKTFRKMGIPSELYPDQTKIKKQMSYANNVGVPYVIVVGPEEVRNRKYQLKNMSSGEQEMCSVDQIIKKLHPN